MWRIRVRVYISDRSISYFRKQNYVNLQPFDIGIGSAQYTSVIQKSVSNIMQYIYMMCVFWRGGEFVKTT